jgi:hypothetical protein
MQLEHQNSHMSDSNWASLATGADSKHRKEEWCDYHRVLSSVT